MALSAEVMIPARRTDTALAMLKAMRDAIGETDNVTVTDTYRGGCDWLVMYGVGRPGRSEMRDAQIAAGGRVLLLDLGYIGRHKLTGYLRASIDQDHPQAWMDRTVPEPSRWDAHGIKLREDYKPGGHVILAGLGHKSHIYYGTRNWEAEKLKDLLRRFPERQIIYRPKPNNVVLSLPNCQTDQHTPIEQLLRGASLVCCRQSNVAVDAAIAGVPFECEDGAAYWLLGKPYTKEARLDFLRRLMWWQYRPSEAQLAWWFIKGIANVAA